MRGMEGRDGGGESFNMDESRERKWMGRQCFARTVEKSSACRKPEVENWVTDAISEEKQGTMSERPPAEYSSGSFGGSLRVQGFRASGQCDEFAPLVTINKASVTVDFLAQYGPLMNNFGLKISVTLLYDTHGQTVYV